MPTVNLTDGSTFDLDSICWVERYRSGVVVCYEIEEDLYEKRFFDRENADLIMSLVKEFSIEPDDITPDDIAHIEHPGMTFAEMLAFFRQE